MESARLIIRPPLESDIDAMMAIRHSTYVLKYNGMKVIGREEFAKKLRQEAAEHSVLHLERKEDHRVIGAVFIVPDGLRHKVQSVCLSYYLGERYSGQGYMSEALGEVLKYLFGEKKMDVVSARVFAPNTASIGLLKKLGFTCEGCLRHAVRGYEGIVYDDVVFSILRAEFLAGYEESEGKAAR